MNRPSRILIINPNTSTYMTDALKPIVTKLNYSADNVHFDYFTAPSTPVTLSDGQVIEGIPSINSGDDSARSALHVRSFLEPLVSKYDAFLVACYSAHPFVGMLKSKIEDLENAARQNKDGTIRGEISLGRRRYVTGIFEASIVTSLMLISSFRLLNEGSLHKAQVPDSFGIVTTGKIWKEELTKAVLDMIVSGSDNTENNGINTSVSTSRFTGVETTGLNASELHEISPADVHQRMRDATERLLKSSSHPVRAVCLGCAGMVGMEEAVREGCIKAYGEIEGEKVHIIDGVVAGVGLLVNACRANF